jgi:limonene-1,2-epoxide hydrolase
MNNEETVRAFVAAWSRLDVDELIDFFCEDGVYHNMPVEPVTGHASLRAFIAGFIGAWDSTDWEIVNLQADGERVFVERIDRTVVAGKSVDLPCCGVFEMRGGKIAVWRDYFDMATYMKVFA